MQATPPTTAQLPAWHALTIAETEARLGTGPLGLTDLEARFRSTLAGLNLVQAAEPVSRGVLFFRQFTNPLVLILIAAATISLAVGDAVDAAVIVVVLLINATLGYLQEYRAERSVRALLVLAAPRARVIRGGQERDIPAAELVAGDLVIIESGSRVPADIRLRTATSLRIDESALTGESTGVSKSPVQLPEGTTLVDRRNMLFAGSFCSSGRGRGYVVAIGVETALGKLATVVRQERRELPPLHYQLVKLGRMVGLVALGSAGIAFALGLARGHELAAMFMVAVALAVSVVPEGLPIASTITLALGVRRLAARRVVVRRLAAVETLGSTTVIGTDKTGTLTQNRMTVERVWAGGAFYAPPGTPQEGSILLDVAMAARHPTLRTTLTIGVLTSEAEIYQAEHRWEGQGDPTEVALLFAAQAAGLEPEVLRAGVEVEATLPFEPDLRYSASIVRKGHRRLLMVKGAPERIIRMLAGNQDSAADRKRATQLHSVTTHMAENGHRVLAMASRELPGDTNADESLRNPQGLTLAGMVGMTDPPRVGVQSAIVRCQGAGIRVVMITGDHSGTAQAIATRVGILGAEGPVVTGEQLDTMAPEELAVVAGRTAVFARVSPQHKLAIVRALQAQGEVVAITGDGVNDAPALKAASIGIAMGHSGTDVAREASDIVLEDDHFVSIAAAVEEGRITFGNIRKVTLFLLSTNGAEVLALLTALALGWPLPFLAIQLLWLNLVSEGIQHVALAFEPGEGNVMQQRPRQLSQGILPAILQRRLILAAIVQAAGTLALFRFELARGATILTAQTVALTTLVLFQTVQIGNCRSEHRSAFALSPLANPLLVVAAGAALLVHVLAMHLTFTQLALGVEPLPLMTWVRMSLVALTVILAVELDKQLSRPRLDPTGIPPIIPAPECGVQPA